MRSDSHGNRFEIIILFYILHDCIVKFEIEKMIFHWIAREFKIVNDFVSTIVCMYEAKFWNASVEEGNIDFLWQLSAKTW